MKPMIGRSLYDTCLSFVSIGIGEGKEKLMEESGYVW